MIIIPDIHGRAFWKEAVKGHTKDTIVFLGDYLDPYADEWPLDCDIWKQTWDNFNEIIEFKKKYPKNVILLLGNHDIHYLYRFGSGSRYDSFHAKMIGDKFEENKNLFQLAYKKTINGKQFVFSHAGIHKLWINDWFGNVVTKRNVVDYLNNAYLVDSPDLPRALDQYSAYRGGWDSYGSMVWADMREWYSEQPRKSDYGDVQIFGHTQLKNSAVNFHNTYYCLDARRGFLIDKEGNVCEMDGAVVPETVKPKK